MLHSDFILVISLLAFDPSVTDFPVVKLNLRCLPQCQICYFTKDCISYFVYHILPVPKANKTLLIPKFPASFLILPVLFKHMICKSSSKKATFCFSNPKTKSP